MISVIIPTYKNPKCLKWCLKSAIENAHSTEYEIIVVVDGFIEQSQDVLDRYKGQISVLDLGQNMGMQHALNMGVYNASYERILIVNDDNVFPKDWDIILTSQRMTYATGVGYAGQVCTPNQIEPMGPSIFDFKIKDFGNPDTFDLDAYTKWEIENRTGKTSYDGGIFPFLIRKVDYMTVGGFDTLYQSPFICDWDFFLKLEMLGVGTYKTDELAFYHFGSMATKNRTDSESDRFKKSEQDAFETFRYKWGFPAFRGENNTHKPTGQDICGIKF
jgi:glycosyltransferase involved in cell wall biosynthesis